MKRLSFVARLLLGLAIMLPSATVHAASGQASILVYGDSLSSGHGLQPGEEWPELLQARLAAENKPYTVVNASISGETTQGGLARFKGTFKKHRPAIVILELGANDGLRGQPLHLMRENLGKMIRYSLDHKARVLLVSMEIPANYGKRYVSAFQQSFPALAEQYNIARTGFLLEPLYGKPELFQPDRLHPTAAAQPLLLETVWKPLQPLL